MNRTHLLLVLPGLAMLVGCQTQTTVHQSTIAAQFDQLNRNGWAVNDNSAPGRAPQADDPNVHVVREADFTGFRFNTNFQVNDPRVRPQAQNQPPSASAPPQNPQSGANPWGVAPVTSGR